MKFDIVSMDAKDLEDCADIHRNSFSNAWSDGEISELLKSKSTKGILARKQGDKNQTVYAFLLYRSVAKELEIITIATHPKYRKNGAASVLLSQMIRDGLGERMEEVFLEVDEANRSALALYKKFGFSKVGERTGYYKSSSSTSHSGNALIMRLDLTE